VGAGLLYEKKFAFEMARKKTVLKEKEKRKIVFFWKFEEDIWKI
jgi:hypothetical protein